MNYECAEVKQKSSNILFIFTTLFLFTIFAQTILSQDLFKIKDNGLWGYMNREGEVVIKPKYIEAGMFSEGIAPVREAGQYGFIDEAGNYVIPKKFDYAESFSNGLALVATGGVYNFVNYKGQELLPHQNSYWFMDSFKNGNVIAYTNPIYMDHKCGLLDIKGKLVLDTTYDLIINSNGVLLLQYSEKGRNDSNTFRNAVADSTGKIIVPADKYEHIDFFENGFAKAYNDNYQKCDFIDTRGNIVYSFKPKYAPAIENISESAIIRHIGNRYLVTDLKDNVLINDTNISFMTAFHEGRAFAELKDPLCVALIDKYGKLVSRNYFDLKTNGSYWGDGLVTVYKNKLCGVINSKGEFKIKPKYQKLSEKLYDGRYFFYGEQRYDSEGKYTTIWGLADIKGNEITEARFEKYDSKGFVNGLLAVVEKGLIGYINKSGNYIWQKKKASVFGLKKINIDYPLPSFIHVYEEENTNYLEEYYAEFMKPTGINDNFVLNKFEMNLTDDGKLAFRKSYEGISLTVSNTTQSVVSINSLENALNLAIEAKDPNGNWIQIEEFPYVTMDENQKVVKLRTGNYFKVNLPKYYGSLKTKIRACLEILGADGKWQKVYSNEIDCSVNPGQFWRVDPHHRLRMYNDDFFKSIDPF